MLSGIASFGRSYQDVEHMKGVRPSTGLVERRGRSEKAEESRRRLKKVEEGWCCHVITHMYMHAIMVTCHVFIYYDKHSIPTEANSVFGHRISVFRHLELREVKGTCEHNAGGHSLQFVDNVIQPCLLECEICERKSFNRLKSC